MADDDTGQSGTAEAVATWRAPIELTALILLGAIGFSIVGGITNGVFTPGTGGWRRITFIGFNVLGLWHVALLAVVVTLVLVLRIPFAPDERGAGIARIVFLGSVAVGGVIAFLAFLGAIATIAETGGIEPTIPEKIGQLMQFLGAGAVAVAVVLLALRGLSVLPAPVRAAPPVAVSPPTTTSPTAPAGPPLAAPVAPGWAADPFGRHQWRYWDGNRWTEQVADGSTQSTDPPS